MRVVALAPPPGRSAGESALASLSGRWSGEEREFSVGTRERRARETRAREKGRTRKEGKSACTKGLQ